MAIDSMTENLKEGTGWLLIAAGTGVERPGRYADDPRRSYVWDSTVPNHAMPQVGDLVALWDKRWLLGISVISEIRNGAGMKTVYRCPKCGSSDVRNRKVRVPKYRCAACEAEFQTPDEKEIEVATYSSRHDAAWVDLEGLLTAGELRGLAESPKSQHSIRRLRTRNFIEVLARRGADVSLALVAKGREAVNPAGGHGSAVVRVRRGQQAFRGGLVKRFGNTCAITGSQPLEALEACHLYPYADVGEHDLKGGLLLRRDLHRLFDLGLIAIEPEVLRVDVAPHLSGFQDYETLQGASLKVEVSVELRSWLGKHWNFHRGG